MSPINRRRRWSLHDTTLVIDAKDRGGDTHNLYFMLHGRRITTAFWPLFILLGGTSRSALRRSLSPTRLSLSARKARCTLLLEVLVNGGLADGDPPPLRNSPLGIRSFVCNACNALVCVNGRVSRMSVLDKRALLKLDGVVISDDGNTVKGSVAIDRIGMGYHNRRLVERAVISLRAASPRRRSRAGRSSWRGGGIRASG